MIGSESLYMLDVDFCYIYLIKSEFNLIERYRLVPCIYILIYDKKTANYLRFYADGSIRFNFAYIPDRINHLRVGKLKFDTCNI